MEKNVSLTLAQIRLLEKILEKRLELSQPGSDYRFQIAVLLDKLAKARTDRS